MTKSLYMFRSIFLLVFLILHWIHRYKVLRYREPTIGQTFFLLILHKWYNSTYNTYTALYKWVIFMGMPLVSHEERHSMIVFSICLIVLTGKSSSSCRYFSFNKLSPIWGITKETVINLFRGSWFQTCVCYYTSEIKGRDPACTRSCSSHRS